MIHVAVTHLHQVLRSVKWASHTSFLSTSPLRASHPIACRCNARPCHLHRLLVEVWRMNAPREAINVNVR